MDSRARELFDEAVQNCRTLARAERAAQLERRYYKAWDSRRVHQFSYEVGRAQALIDLVDDLRGEVFDPERVRAEAWDEAEEKWRSRHAVGVLVDAAVERHRESDLDYGA